jgi:hypothetical protein
MIDRFELRGGNLIYDENKNPVKVTRDILRAIKNKRESEKYSAIPLDGSWLEELGFMRDEKSKEYYHKKLSFRLRGSEDSNEWEVVWSNGSTRVMSKKVQTVHQLQNFAFDWSNSRLHYSKK